MAKKKREPSKYSTVNNPEEYNKMGPGKRVGKGFPRHLQGLTIKEMGFVKDYAAHGEQWRAAMDNYNCKSKTNASKVADVVKNKPHIIAALERELEIKFEKRAKKFNVDEEFVQEQLMDLLSRAKDKEDLKSANTTLNSLMKLKGLGSEKVINENVQKKEFEFESPTELLSHVMDIVVQLVDDGVLNLDDLIGELGQLNEKHKQLKEPIEVREVIPEIDG